MCETGTITGNNFAELFFLVLIVCLQLGSDFIVSNTKVKFLAGIYKLHK